MGSLKGKERTMLDCGVLPVLGILGGMEIPRGATGKDQTKKTANRLFLYPPSPGSAAPSTHESHRDRQLAQRGNGRQSDSYYLSPGYKQGQLSPVSQTLPREGKYCFRSIFKIFFPQILKCRLLNCSLLCLSQPLTTAGSIFHGK